ncbi:MAG: PAS-domain containing protein [Gemmobacter sp.]|uniref:PAS-domain containing protein n=1 Tax=Gemmobacter sp. TaxID=1898957 RepID=UPI0039191A9A
MTHGLINPADPPERQREKLLTILDVLMRRVEQTTDASGAAYAQFERAAMLEDQVRDRTRDLERALDLLHQSNAQLAGAMRAADAARRTLADAIETVQEGFALFDPSDVLVMCNSRFGMQMSDIRPHLRPGLSFQDYVGHVSRSRHLSLPRGQTPEDWAIARLRRHRDRHVIFNVQLDGDRWVQVSEHRTRDGGTVILQTDVTGIIRTERLERGKLLDDQARIVRATLDHISQGVCIFDPEARLLGWNDRAAQLLAIPLARFRLGLGFDDLVARLQADLGPTGAAALAALRDWLRQPAPRAPLRFALQHGAGGPMLDAFAQGMPDGGFVVSFTDVTAERQAIAALSRANETLEARVAARTLELEDALSRAERANAARSRFVAAASHDLLQPLSAARLFLASAGDEPLPPRARDALVKAGAALDSVETILEALLDISRLESGRAAVTMAPVALGPLLARLADECAPLAAEKGLRLRLRPTAAVVLSDAAYLRRILQNLIGNAVRYTETGGVLVGVRRSGAHAVRVEIVDTGPGIPEEEQENIFREFHRLNARASASEGLGLGLAIVERAAGLLGHPLHLDSRVGRGTRFCLRLGLAEALADPRPAAALPPLAPPPAPARDLVALLVEPDAGLRAALSHLLEGRGMAVLESDSAEAAAALLAELGILPDFVLMDAPGNGQAALAGWQALRPALGALPALLLSPDRGPSFRAAAAAAGAGVLAKPLDPAALDRFLARLGARA